MSALYNLRQKGTILTLGEDELLTEMVRSHPCFYKKKKKKKKNPEKNTRNEKRSHWKVKKETIVLRPIILFNYSMP